MAGSVVEARRGAEEVPPLFRLGSRQCPAIADEVYDYRMGGAIDRTVGTKNGCRSPNPAVGFNKSSGHGAAGALIEHRQSSSEGALTPIAWHAASSR